MNEQIKKKISGIKLLNHVSDEQDTEQQLIANALIQSAGEFLDKNPGETVVRLSAHQLSDIFPGKKRRQLSSFTSNFDRYALSYSISLNNGIFWKVKSHKTDLDIDVLLSRHQKEELPTRQILGNIDFSIPEKEKIKNKNKDGTGEDELDEFSSEAQENIKRKTINEDTENSDGQVTG